LVEAEAARLGMTALRWTVDPRDWARPGTAAIVAAVNAGVAPGGVILLHDGGGDRTQSVAALRVLLSTLPARGFRFVLPPAQPMPY
jgi:peptidoglycan/xylan/chitin deacetylase (PgdA/CDA1 family)